MYQLELRDTSDYAKLLSRYVEQCDEDDSEELNQKHYGAVGSDSLDMPYLEELFCHFVAKKESVDEAIKSNLRGWKFSRIALADLAILRVAITEILYLDDIPAKVSVDEAVELAKIYGEEKSPQFINGLLANYVD